MTASKWTCQRERGFVTDTLITPDGYEANIWRVDKAVNGCQWKINIMASDGEVVLDGLDPPRAQTKTGAQDYAVGRINFHRRSTGARL